MLPGTRVSRESAFPGGLLGKPADGVRVGIHNSKHRKSETADLTLAGRLLAAQEVERAHIARELHDDIGQSIAIVSMQLDRLGLLLNGASNEADDQLNDAAAWRSQPKWVVSRSLKSVGPNATLVADDIEAVIRMLKAELAGEIDIAGPDLARSLTEAGLIDEYRLYLHPVVLGRGKPFFGGPRPRLRLVASDLIVEDVIRLTYVPA
jgi:hypothetical protein